MLEAQLKSMILGARALSRHGKRPAEITVVQAETADNRYFRIRYDAATSMWPGGVDAFEGGEASSKGRLKSIGTIGKISEPERLFTLRCPDEVTLVSGERLIVWPFDYWEGLIAILTGLSKHTIQPHPAIAELLTNGYAFADKPVNRLETASNLTHRQSRAMQGIDLPLSWVWGPPGTGKTRTLGGIAALVAAAGHRVLLLASSNRAADQITLAVDDAFDRESLTRTPGDVLRVGSVTNEELIGASRPHLLRWNTELQEIGDRIWRLLREFARLNAEASGPLAERDLHLLKRRDETQQELQDAERMRTEIIRKMLQEAKCVVTNTWQALNKTDLEDWPADVVGFDEASMIAIPTVVAATAGRNSHIVIAGDPMQLPPTMIYDNPVLVDSYRVHKDEIKPWYGRSLFDLVGAKSLMEKAIEDDRITGASILDVQHRMAEPIANVVSYKFYSGEIGTAEGLSRQAPRFSGWPEAPLIIIDPTAATMPPGATARTATSAKVCSRSAIIAADLAHALHRAQCSCLLITPYRNMATRLLELIPSIQGDACDAMTIHKAQGSEADVVIFCLVRAGWFLGVNPEAPNVLAVALSRARCQLIVVARDYELRAAGILQPLLDGGAQRWTPDWAKFEK